MEVLFDAYGVPHIYDENEEDAYFSLGFVHTQDRLFQLEMMRRVGTGTLAVFLVRTYWRLINFLEHSEFLIMSLKVPNSIRLNRKLHGKMIQKLMSLGSINLLQKAIFRFLISAF